MRDEPGSHAIGGRTSFRRRVDFVALAVLVVACLTVALTVWARSDIHTTVSRTGPASVHAPAAPDAVPASLRQAWQARSDATPVPVAHGPTVVSADGGTVLGRDPLTGHPRWRYQRDLDLCTVSTGWSMVVAVYHRSRNCSEVTALDPTTGERGPQRNGDAERDTRLVGDGTYLTTTGPTLSDTWRSDLVKTTEYGKVPDFKNPDRQPRPECHHGSVAAADGKVGVIEHCPHSSSDRITVYKAKSEDSDDPEVTLSTGLDHSDARIVAMTETRIAIAMPGVLQVRDLESGKQLAQYPLRLPRRELSGDPAGDVTPVTEGEDAFYWFTGSRTVALARTDLRPEFTVGGTLGPGCRFADKLLLPVHDGIAVVDPASGVTERTIAVDRHGYTGTVAMNTLGPVVLEQRGDTLVALRSRS